MPADSVGGWVANKDCDIDMSEYIKVKSSVKYLVLDQVAARGSMDYRQLASITGMPDPYAAERLTRYARRGLLTRDRDGDGGLSTFELSAKGRERLRYFERC